MTSIKVSMLGTRGSVPVSGACFARYGGASSCVLLEAGGETIILDAGTGILAAADPTDMAKRYTVLLSHPHADHLIGLPMFTPMFNPDCQVDVYADRHMGRSTQEQILLLMNPPLWPCSTEVFHAGVRMLELPQSGFSIGPVRVDWMEGNHPGGCTVFRLTNGGASVVYCTDFEHGNGHTARLTEFARDADLLIYDAQYSPSEYRNKKGWGHSTWLEGAKIGRQCGVGRVIFTHHLPERTDGELDRIEEMVQRTYPECSFARHCEEVLL